MKDLRDILFHQYGRMSFLYMLAPGKPSYFNPATLQLLEPPLTAQINETNGELEMVTNYKKDPEARRGALVDYVIGDLTRFSVDNTKDMLTDDNASAVLMELLNHPKGKKVSKMTGE
jgi:hypothetical protein